MDGLRILGNIIWLVFGGLEMALGWWLAALIMAVSIIGIPWARACFVIGIFCIWPFGREVRNRREVTGVEDLGTGPLGFVGNVIWFLLAGFWLALGHLFVGLIFFITIIGIPFGVQHFKLAGLSLAPVGKSVVDIEPGM